MASLRSVLTGRPSISVAMATYNGERFLPEMLESLAVQTLLPDEVVIRDDGSEDATVSLLHGFARRVPFRVEVMTGGPHLGHSQNAVVASRVCRGSLILFADQDDVWRPTKLATVADRVRRRTPLAMFHDYALVDEQGARRADSCYDLLAERGLPPAAAYEGCTMAVTRRFVDDWGWPGADSGVPHDYWVALLATAFGQRRNLRVQLSDHRLHGVDPAAWVPEAPSHERGKGVGPLRALVDLGARSPDPRSRTRVFLEVLQERGDAVDHAAAKRLRKLLRADLRRHRSATR